MTTHYLRHISPHAQQVGAVGILISDQDCYVQRIDLVTDDPGPCNIARVVLAAFPDSTILSIWQIESLQAIGEAAA